MTDRQRILKNIADLLDGKKIIISGMKVKLFKPGDYIKMPSFEEITEHYWLGYEVENHVTKEKFYIGAGFDFAGFLDYLSKESTEVEK